jgi:integrase
VAGHRTGDNPARWAGNLKELLPPPSKVANEGNHPALTLDDAPRWFAALQAREGFGARALELATLTATRSQEVRGARWDEIDLEGGLWIIPAARMKMDREHRVPLSPLALDLLRALPRLAGNPLVFPAARGGEMSDMTLSATMKRMHEADIAQGGKGYLDRVSKRPAVPHGLRSTFRDWVAEKTTYPGDMAEVALAHRISNAVEASYRRGDMIEKRRRLMADWSNFLSNLPASVVALYVAKP